jgi:hypothetical protein
VLGGDTQYNNYSFPGGNAVNQVDPMGLAAPAVSLSPEFIKRECERFLTHFNYSRQTMPARMFRAYKEYCCKTRPSAGPDRAGIPLRCVSMAMSRQRRREGAGSRRTMRGTTTSSGRGERHALLALPYVYVRVEAIGTDAPNTIYLGVETKMNLGGQSTFTEYHFRAAGYNADESCGSVEPSVCAVPAEVEVRKPKRERSHWLGRPDVVRIAAGSRKVAEVTRIALEIKREAKQGKIEYQAVGYNCWHFVAEVLYTAGFDRSAGLNMIGHPPPFRKWRSVTVDPAKGFAALKKGRVSEESWKTVILPGLANVREKEALFDPESAVKAVVKAAGKAAGEMRWGEVGSKVRAMQEDWERKLRKERYYWRR